MKILIALFLLFSIQKNEFKQIISYDTSKEDLQQIISNAKEKGIAISIPYASYDNGEENLRTVQLKVDAGDGFSGTITGSFLKANNKILIYRNFDSKAKIPFYLGLESGWNEDEVK